MDSLASLINRKPRYRSFRHSLMGWSAVLRADLTTLNKSWIVRIWLLALLMTFLMVPVAMLVTNRAAPIPASVALAAYLGFFLNVWGIVIIVLSAGSISSEADIVADGILSRACTRTQYILAKLSARVLVIGGVYLIGAGAAAYASSRYGLNDVTWYTMLTGIAIVGMAIFMLVSLGVTMSVIFNNTIVSVIGLLLLWYVAGYIFTFAGAAYMSPTSLTRNLPQILRDSTPPKVVSCVATKSSLAIKFSKQINPDTAERIENYTIETSKDSGYTLQTAIYNKSEKTVILSGLKFPVNRKVTVTVDGVADMGGNILSPAADSATSRPVSAKGSNVADSASDSSERTSNKLEKSKSETSSTAAKDSPRNRRRSLLQVVQVSATPVSASVVFSQDMDPVKVEKIDKYVVESPLGTTQVPQTAAYSPSTKTVLLGGLSFKKGDPVKVTVKDVTSTEGKKISAINSAIFREVQNWKYLAGFGMPALVFLMFGVVWFSRRDL
ncbi:MAG: hypothetical protein ACYC27_01240 [Armatimonadota bacterium]